MDINKRIAEARHFEELNPNLYCGAAARLGYGFLWKDVDPIEPLTPLENSRITKAALRTLVENGLMAEQAVDGAIDLPKSTVTTPN